MVGRKWKQFSLKEKKKILNEVNSNVRKCETVRKYEISPSKLSTSIKDKNKIEKNISSIQPLA
jgi:hypothetical protein